MSTGGGGGGGGGKLGSNTDTDGALLLLLTFAFGGRPLGRFVGDGDDDFFACLLGDEAFFFSAEDDDLGRGLPLFFMLLAAEWGTLSRSKKSRCKVRKKK